MATAGTQLDRSAVRQRVLEILRELLVELGSTGALPRLSANSELDADLGMGSLERVELLARIEAVFGVRLADRVVAEANTPDDLAVAIAGAGELDVPDDAGSSALRASVTAGRLHREAVAAGAYETRTLLELLRYRATHDADRTHLLITEETGDGEREVTLTFGELYAAGQRCAAELAREGVAAGARVALMLPSGRAFFVSYAGILLAGAVPVPIYPPFRADRIEEYAARQSAILSNAEVSVLLTFERAEAVAKLLKPRVRSLTAVLDAERLIAAADKPAEVIPGALPLHLSGARNRKPDDLALLQYTSGSTGDPKGVMLTHANLLANMRSIGEAMRLGPDDVGISWLPLYHDMGLIGAWLSLLHFGTPLVVMSPLAFLTRPERWLQAFHKHRGTIAAGPNFAYELCVRKIADRDIAGIDLSSWRIALNGAEPVNPDTLERFSKRFAPYGFRATSMAPVYGLAEASLCVTFPPLDRLPLIDHVERETFTTRGQAVPIHGAEAKAISFVSAGRVVNRMEVSIVDDAGKEVPDRSEGFLWFRGPSATSGFFRNPAATEKLLPLGPVTQEGQYAWVNSGDRAYRAAGEIYVTGRVKDIIIKGGRNLYPHEVEELAARVEGIRKGCIVAFGIKDEASGTERLLLVAEAREGNAARRAAIVAAITEQITKGLGLPPDRVELLPPGSIPKTSSGKLRREETKQLYVQGTLSKSKAPAWLQIARLGLASAISNSGSWLAGAARRTGQVAYGIYFAVVFSLWIVPSWIIVQFIKDHRAAGRFTTRALRVLFAFTGNRVDVVGKEFMDTPGAKIYAANHSSYIDVLPLILGLGVSYRFVSKVENRRVPFIGTFLKQMGHLTFDRADRDARLNQSREIEELLQRGESVFVFPEGTFLPQDGVRPFQLGAFKAAVSTGRPIIPVSVAGARQILREGTWLPRPGNITITLSPPLYPQSPNGHSANASEPGDWHQLIQLRDATREAIGRHSGEPLL
ncbi:MAG: AMP-binding protein [Candidatus Acidiferrum sp.]